MNGHGPSANIQDPDWAKKTQDVIPHESKSLVYLLTALAARSVGGAVSTALSVIDRIAGIFRWRRN